MLNLYLDKLGFTENDSVSLYIKDKNDNWTISETKLEEGEIYQEIELTDGADLIIKAENTTVDKDVVETGNVNILAVVSVTLSVMCLFVLVLVVLNKRKTSSDID